jgi:NTE family protein
MKPRIALALSGGGFRASIFHLGLLKRLAELNWLPKVDVISTVSGGSIVGAFLTLHWHELIQAGGDAQAFTSIISEPFLRLIESRNFLTEWLSGSWQWPFRKLLDRSFTRTQAAAELLDDWFFNNKRCRDLPDIPLLILNATSLQSIRAWRFTNRGLGDSRFGHSAWADRSLSIGTCVGASAAFPPVFPPVRIRREHYSFSGPVYGERDLPHFPLIPLSDGGVYDNNGLEVLIKPVSVPGMDDRLETADFLIVSDGGAAAKYQFNSAGLPVVADALLLYRVDEIAREQVTALRSRSLIADFLSRKRQGLFVSLKSEVGRMGEGPYANYCKHVSPKYQIPGDLLDLIRSIRTSLDRFSNAETTALMYHAYLMTDAFLWCYRETFASRYQVAEIPNPRWLVEFSEETINNWRAALKDSPSAFRVR